MNNLYFDIAATTPLDENVAKFMTEVQSTIFGNPSSIHQFGQKSRALVEKSRRQVANALSCKPNEIIFTGSGSESNNLVLQGYLNSGDHLITTSYEHPAIMNVSKELEKKGVDVSYVNPEKNGTIDSEKIKKEIKPTTKLISVMYVNNELGCINPLNEIVSIGNEHNIKIHTDAVQIIGKKAIDLSQLKVDFLSIAPHKYYGPKGIGGLFVRNGSFLNPILQGGGQEQNIRPGTENISSIAGMGLATEIAFQNIEKNYGYITELEQKFLKLLKEKNISFKLNGENRLSGILNITFPNISGTNLVMKLDLNGFAISFGSACSSGTPKASKILLNLGLNNDEALRTVRISIGKIHKENDIIKLANCLEQVLKKESNKDMTNV